MTLPPRLLGKSADDASDRRRCGRIRCEQLFTRFGEVLDLSASGMRALCKRWRAPRVGAELEIEIRHPQGVARIPSKIMWVRRKGLRTYEVGFEFVHEDEASREKLTEITRLALQSVAIAHSRSRFE